MNVHPPVGADDPESVDHPGRSDGLVRGLAEAIGGPIGEHAVGLETGAGRWSGRFWTAARIVLALTCLTLALHWVQKSPCQDGAWADHEQYKLFCYTDVLALYYAEGLNEGKVPYLDHPVEYPVLTGALMGVLGLPVHAIAERRAGTGDPINESMWFYNANALVLLSFAVATAATLLALRRRRPWDVALFALSPALLLTATVNWDFLAIALAVWGIYAWARRRPVLAGVLLGLGTAAKLWPGFLFIALLFLGIRARRIRPVAQAILAGLSAWMVVNLPVIYANAGNWARFIELNSERGVDWGTLWYIGDHFPRGGDQYGLAPFQWLSQHVPTLNWLTYVLIAVAWLVIGAIVLAAPRRPRLGQVAFLVVAVFLIFNKVWSQQFVLWLLPLAVLARPRWGAFVAWQAAEVCYFAAFYGELLGAAGRNVFPEGVFVLASVLRLGTVVVLCVLIVVDILRPEQDAVRQIYPDDPDGGVFDGLPQGRQPPRGRGPGLTEQLPARPVPV